MTNKLPSVVVVTPTGEEVSSSDVQNDSRHFLNADVNIENRDIQLSFSTRQAMYDFAKSLLQESVYGKGGQKEFYPLAAESKNLVVDGVRMSEKSSRIFVFYEDE
ncbi:hypothetical protein [Sapientia aquatica]|uniref:Uncharacterized protein n=1 Tax=Sapientia aquatica TaxID=1549640 RepID=A0A4R5W1V4_9BURK|nr:hypothetical protein [Sapientia aquatica]TDK66386.1 hypothetical protein E2I14_07890 [Sapientia aquatica]